MTISELQRLRPAGLAPPGEIRPLPNPSARDLDGADFKSTFESAINKVDAAQKDADGQIKAFVAGEQEDLHEVMLAMESAKVYFHLMTEVRNRMLETYQELMRMQV